MLQRIYIGIYAQSWQAKEEGGRKLFFFCSLVDIDLLTIIWCEHVLQGIISLELIRWKKISFMTYFDWKYYKELLIRNKELEKVQREFTVVVIKIKMWVLLLQSFLLPVKRDSDVARELICYVQSGQKELQFYSNQMNFPLNKLPITSVVVVIILL